MVVQSQHHPSSTFVLARARGLTLEVPPVFEAAGYSEGSIRDAQAFYDICARFEPGWSESFADGVIPSVPAWLDWRALYFLDRLIIQIERGREPFPTSHGLVGSRTRGGG